MPGEAYVLFLALSQVLRLDTSIAVEIPHNVVPTLSESNSHLIDIQHCITVKAYAEGTPDYCNHV